MNLNRAPVAYSAEEQDRVRREISQADNRNRKAGKDVEVAGSERVIIASPNGARWALAADDAGVLTLVPA